MSSRRHRDGYPRPALIPVASLNSGDTGEGTEVNGLTVDSYVTGRRYRRVVVKLGGRSVNASNRFWKLTANLQDSTATGSGWTDYGTAQTDTGSFGASGTTDAVFSWEEDLTDANRYLRVQFTPEAITDTGGNTTATGGVLSYYGELVLTDANRLPASG